MCAGSVPLVGRAAQRLCRLLHWGKWGIRNRRVWAALRRNLAVIFLQKSVFRGLAQWVGVPISDI